MVTALVFVEVKLHPNHTPLPPHPLSTCTCGLGSPQVSGVGGGTRLRVAPSFEVFRSDHPQALLLEERT